MVCDDKEIEEASKPEPFDWHTEMNKRLTISKKSIRCRECRGQYHTTSSNAALVHMETFHFKEVTSLQCPHCDLICDSFINYNSHVRLKHNVRLTISLNKIPKAEDEVSSLAIINESIVHRGGGRPRGFLWQSEIMRRIRMGEAGYLCSDCDFSSRPLAEDGGRQILAHIETEHMDISGYRCRSCHTVIPSFIHFFKHLSSEHNINLQLLQKFSL